MKKIIYIVGLFVIAQNHILRSMDACVFAKELRRDRSDDKDSVIITVYPEKELYEIMPFEIWKEVSSYLEHNDKALVNFCAPRFGLTEEQAYDIVQDINKFYLDKSQTIEDQIFYLEFCRAFKTHACRSNARELIVKFLKRKIKKITLLHKEPKGFLETVLVKFKKENDFAIFKKILPLKYADYLSAIGFYSLKNNSEKLMHLKEKLNIELKTFDLLKNGMTKYYEKQDSTVILGSLSWGVSFVMLIDYLFIRYIFTHSEEQDMSFCKFMATFGSTGPFFYALSDSFDCCRQGDRETGEMIEKSNRLIRQYQDKLQFLLSQIDLKLQTLALIKKNN